MRIATLILALLLMVPVTVQSCAVYAGSSMLGQQSEAGGAAVGLLIALLWLIGAAFVWGFPTVSLVMFLLAGVLAFMVGATTRFGDMTVWGIVALVLAGMSFLSRREVRSRKREKRGPREEAA